MLYPRPFRFVPLGLLGLSVALHFVTLILYTRLPDRLAAFTVFPVWTWGTVGFLLSGLAFLFYRERLSLLISLVWALTIFILADETRPLSRFGSQRPAVGHPDAAIRVITHNCHSAQDPAAYLASHGADIIFLQEIPSGYQVKKLVETLYGGEGDYRFYSMKSCAVIVRGRITHNINVPQSRCQLITARLHTGDDVQLMNVHLHPAATNLRFWTKRCWLQHFHNRLRRRTELAYQLTLLQKLTPALRLPTIIAGDFNAPANDPIYDLLHTHFVNVFASVGAGWGNTFPSVLPLLRIDHIFVNPDHLFPDRCQALTVGGSDHRMVIADLLIR